MTALLDLAARCEAAEGPDRELDIVLWRLFVPVGQSARPNEVPLPWDWRFTASLDAAMQLAPEGKVWNVHYDPRQSRGCVMDQDGFNQIFTLAATPALALCAAALRARSAQP